MNSDDQGKWFPRRMTDGIFRSEWSDGCWILEEFIFRSWVFHLLLHDFFLLFFFFVYYNLSHYLSCKAIKPGGPGV